MATVASPAVDTQTRERRFYSRMAIFLVVLMFAGFAPSFYLRDIVPAYPRPNPTLPLSVILHGLLFTLWMLVLVAQTQLVAANRRDIHMKLGTASMVLAIAMVPFMYLIGVWQVARNNVPPFTTPLDWTSLPLFAIPAFVILVWQGWKRRREAQWHKRLMLGAAMVVVLGPSFGRLPLVPPSKAGFALQMTASLLFFLPLFIWDRRTIGRTHPATWLAFGAYALSMLIPVGPDRHRHLGADRAAPAGRRELSPTHLSWHQPYNNQLMPVTAKLRIGLPSRSRAGSNRARFIRTLHARESRLLLPLDFRTTQSEGRPLSSIA